MRKTFLLFLSSLLLFSCGMEKRLYRPGYYFHSASCDHDNVAASPIREEHQPDARARNPEKDPASCVLPPSLSPSQPEQQQEESRAGSQGKSLDSSVLILPLLRDTVVAKSQRQNRRNNGNGHEETLGDDLFFLLIIFIEIAGIALFAWAATLVFPTIPIWLAIIIGLLAFYALLIILYLIFARNEV